ncbi:hypothetical protein Ae168Ps1_2437 [Pseudonocardia sp. Ae168_Ps1]|uniref:DUF1707 SHOCT-like domain-containing protein n=1 Tax=unclassified Pseudonocardia TaxID=2619320 RepID=UPI00094ACCF2|nr:MULTISPECIES: DUF1707 domain-containing protein [unclassified Pseudonocardia]OLL74054.1 hypothetical protein Ae150APs1_2432 [Pseudonocardia sp. Ae150A_Ps1]OLL80031.1 hypothetical protein Ae168Ps1_2437 [Pseudonocardia sp. Ae168_Ps1]OLL85837.1 hypothetical protein Ae263Ps1_2892c [Pseudonocardia sp. Ae263_Ps1]OLL94133.1 hypothetical protein Ae356Ps1_4030 [Pseudonocardia sp. Ae356_Ps1]
MTDGSELRVGGTERRAVDARLQRAHGEGRLSLEEYEERSARAWAARTRADLEPLTVDLPADTAAPTVTTAAPASRGRDLLTTAARSAGGALGTVALVAAALWGGSHLISAQDGAAVLSSRTIAVAPDQDRVETRAVLGSLRIVVPDGVRADVSGFTVFGSTECPTACAVPAPRTVTVDASGAFTSIEILTPAEAAADPGRGDSDRDSDDD